MPHNPRPDLARLVFFLSSAFFAGALMFGFGFYAANAHNAVSRVIRGAVADVRLVVRDFRSGAYRGVPVNYLQPARQPGHGVTVNEFPDDGKLVLMAGFFDASNELRLIRRTGDVVLRWPVKFSELFPNASHMPERKTDLNIDLHGAVIHPDGSIVFNFEYGGTVKLGRCGETLWRLAHPTHHSVEFAEGGGYWIPGQTLQSDPQSFPPFTRMKTEKPFEEDLILRVNENGVIVSRKSVPRILYDNGLEQLMTVGVVRHWGNRELVHLNKIGELSRALDGAFEQFEAGDLVLSIRDHNLVLVVDPDDWRVKWHQVGPWRRQHDPEFEPNGTISMFNNNAYSIFLPQSGWSNPALPRVSNILEVDPATARVVVVYGERPGQEFFSTVRGKQEPTADGGHLVTEFEAGRVFEIDAQGRIVWEYINRYDSGQVLEVTEARLYPASYFSVEDWSCPGKANSP